MERGSSAIEGKTQSGGGGGGWGGGGGGFEFHLLPFRSIVIVIRSPTPSSRS